MALHMVETPRTEAADRTRATLNLDFSEMPSFMPPPGADDLVKAMNSRGGNNARHVSLATPSARAPLAARRNPPAKAEFTPLLQSAAKNRLMQMQQRQQQKQGGAARAISTPAALRPGYRMSSPALPEASVLLESEMSVDQTPMPIAESSIAMSTPIPIMPKRGELGLGNGDGANLLTLREQEAKLEKIDKENFGLKLKIHFLEENLQRTGPQYSQQMLRENTELKAAGVMHDRDIKKYQKQLKYAEVELEDYRLQLEEYIEKVKRRHMDEALRDELDKFRQLAEERQRELEELKASLQGSQQNTANLKEVEELQEQVDDLEARVKDKERVIDEKDERIEGLEEKLQDAEGDVNGEMDKKDQQLDAMEDELHQLRAEVQRLREEKEDQDTQNGLGEARQDHAVEIRELRSQVEAAERAKQQQLRQFESRLETYTLEKDAEVEDLQKRLEVAGQGKQSEIEELEFRLKTALSQRDTQSQMREEVAGGLQERMELLSEENDAKIARLEAEVEELEHVKADLERMESSYEEVAETCEALEGERNELLSKIADKENTIKALQSAAGTQGDAANEILRLRRDLEERTLKISDLQRIINTQTISLEELPVVQYRLAEVEKVVDEKAKDLRNKQADIDVKDREIHTLRQTLDNRIEELEILRETACEPHSQVEGLQSIVRHRDQDLGELRSRANQQAAKMEELQRLADERMKALELLREEFADQKQQLEDDIQVLEASLDEAEDKVAELVKGMQVSDDSQTKIEQLNRKLSLCEQKREMLEVEIEELQQDQAVIDSERQSLFSTIEKLKGDLAAARDERRAEKQSPMHSPMPQSTSIELRALKSEQRDLKYRLAEAESALRAAEGKHHDTVRDKAKQHAAELKRIREAMRQQEAETRDARAREEAGSLSAQLVQVEKKKHESEIKGVAKQIQVLRARVARERLFRSELAFQKQWFLKMINMYDQCNASNIRMIEEMGITPDRDVRARRPSLKSVGLMVIFCLRAKKARDGWVENKQLQLALAKKMEIARSRRKRGSVPGAW